MSTDTRGVGYLPMFTNLGQRAAALFRTASRLASGTVRFIDAVRAAGVVAKQAERYYDMSNADLAEIGLSREQIPAALLRALDRESR